VPTGLKMLRFQWLTGWRNPMAKPRVRLVKVDPDAQAVLLAGNRWCC
jgi:hypothetical protein